MAAPEPSTSILSVDPDGDLVLLLEPIPIKSFEPSASKTSINPPVSTIFGTPPATFTGATPVSDLGTAEPKPTQLYKFHILVSSKHMSLASPVFKAMLQGYFQEATELRKTGKTEIPLPDDNATAMIILIDIIHGRFKSVPKLLDLPTLTHLAILVDKYRCHELIELLRTTWTTDVHHGNTWLLNWNNVACWICVTWVFELDAGFEEATEKVIRQSATGLREILKSNELHLPIPEEVIDKVDKRRQTAVSLLVGILEDIISKYQGTTLICPNCFTCQRLPVYGRPGEFANSEDIKLHRRDCDALVLGSLIKSAAEQCLLPLPQAPLYKSLTFSTLKEKIESLKVTTGCFKVLKRASDDHGVLKILKNSVAVVDSQISGLDLADFKKSSRGA